MKATLISAIITMVIIVTACSARKGIPLEEPVTLNRPELLHGQQVFMSYCNHCHPGGAAGLAPAINNKPLPGFMIKFQVRHGMGMMPAFKEEVISSEELDNLTAYLKAVRKN